MGSTEHHVIMCKKCFEEHYETLVSSSLSWIPYKEIRTSQVSWSTADNVAIIKKLFASNANKIEEQKTAITPPFCKKKYYGIDCACGACPLPKRVRI